MNKVVKFFVIRIAIILVAYFGAYFVFMNFFGPLYMGAPNLPAPPRSAMRTDSCTVSEEDAKVHYGELGHEDAWIKYVNDDNTVQVITMDTKLSILFWISSNRIKCFREGSIASVTIIECKESQEKECDFSTPHTVYIRTELVDVLNWKYS